MVKLSKQGSGIPFFFFFVNLCLLVMLSACRTQKAATDGVVPLVVEQPDTTLIPAFSGELLYLFGREYQAMHDSLSDKYDTPEALLVREKHISMSDYIEQRLVTFFPETAYNGMIRKWERIAESLVKPDKQEMVLLNNDELGRFQLRKDIPPMGLTEQEEAAFLQLTDEENILFQYLNTLATSAQMATRAELPDAACRLTYSDNKAFAPDIHASFEEENILVSLLLAGGPYAFYRVILAKKRAETKAKEYYGSDTNTGKIGDAFKHTFVNVLLTAYLSEDIAKFVMNDVWEQWHINAPCDRYMDLHNNYIGRHARYMEFHGTTDDWTIWAENVHHFILDTLSNGNYQAWSHDTPVFQIYYDMRKTPTDKFVYWNMEKTDVSE